MVGDAAGHGVRPEGRWPEATVSSVAGEGPVFARGDEARVLQIGRILVENAIVHTPPGTTVTVTTGLVGGRATLSVSDDGPGIPGDSQDAVFDRFYRLGGTVASGSGLGLAIARELAELMGGTIELVSGPGETRFTLVLAADVTAREPAVSCTKGMKCRG